MSIAPQRVLESSIAQLETLAAVMAEELGSARAVTESATPEARACKEILLTVSVLIPKLQAARHRLTVEDLGGACEGCEA